MFFKLFKQPSESILKSISRSFSEGKILSAEKSSTTAGSNSALYKLRKSTGYALTKCKDALEKHSGNIDEATKWLNEQAQKEGWAKAEKVKNRQTSQGTLVLANDRATRRSTIIELNCETDFVARNEKFLELSSKLATSVLYNSQPNSLKQIMYKDELNQLKYIDDSSRTIGDQLALSIGSLGENMSLRRAVIFGADPTQHLAWYIHGSNYSPINNCHFGKYAALVNLSLMPEGNDKYQAFDIGRQVAQHIVGMKPASIGEIPTEPQDTKTDEPIKIDESETRLLYQEFLMKSDIRVLDFLNENHAKLNDFVRFECGENIENEQK